MSQANLTSWSPVVNFTSMARLVDLSLEPQRNEAECRAILRLDRGLDDVRQVGNLVLQNRRRLHGISSNPGQTVFDFQALQRGDDVRRTRHARLYVHNSDDLNSPSTLAVNGISLADLERDCDRFYNSKEPFRDSTIVKALTVDGVGGRMDWMSGRFSACMLYYLENGYIEVPGLALEKIQAVSRFTLDPRVNLLRPQVEDLRAWYRQLYERAVASCPTHRPITERYFRQLREHGFSTAEEEELGNAFFTDYTFRRLKSQEDEILRRNETA